MARFAAVFSRVSDICVAVLLGVACVGTAAAQDPGARIHLLEEKLIQASPGSLPAVSYSVRDIGRVVGAVRLALPETGGHALVLTETGQVWAWGDNRRGQLGVGDTAVHPEWVAVQELVSVVAIAAGAGHSVALRQDGSVWTWGANEQGQSGDGSLVTGGPDCAGEFGESLDGGVGEAGQDVGQVVANRNLQAAAALDGGQNGCHFRPSLWASY